MRVTPILGSTLRGPFALLFFAFGCSKILGIEDDSVPVECLATKDCAAGYECVSSKCVCTDCGTSGKGAGGTTGGNAGESTAGSGGHSPAPRGGTAGDAGAPAEAGKGGAPSTQGGSGGTVVGPEQGGTSTVGMGGTGGGGTLGSSGQAGEQAVAGAGGETGGCPASLNSPCLCDGGVSYSAGNPRCPATCLGTGVCRIPPSCNSLLTKCGLDSDANCCLSLPVPGDTFSRSCDAGCRVACSDDPNREYPAEVTTFELDAFEVTVGRFRNFVAAYNLAKPEAGSGKNPNNPSDAGWDEAWSDLLPMDQAALISELDGAENCIGPGSTLWSHDSTGFENRPINCVTWYEAQAFCIWDGGRLPTQAEWNFVAAGGKEQRVYPWTTDPSVVSLDYAVYYDGAADLGQPDAVGSHPLGKGRWGHFDLAGNVEEWVWDGYTTCFATPDTCVDCGDTASIEMKETRGGSFLSYYSEITVESRGGDSGSAARATTGFRCARDLGVRP